MEVRRTIALLIVLAAVFFTGFLSRQPDNTTNYENCMAVKKLRELVRPDGKYDAEQDSANHADSPDCRPPEWYAVFQRVEGWQLIIATIGITIIAWQSWETRRSADASKVAAGAAKISADIAASVNVPTLRIETFDVGYMGVANLEAMFQFPKVRIVVKNHGQTPAFLKSWCLIFTCEELPASPVYAGETCGMVLEKDVIQAGASHPLPDIANWYRQQFSLDDVQAIVSRRKVLRAYGYVLYDDLFGSPIKRLKFCELVLNFSSGGIQWATDWSAPAYLGNDYLPKKPHKSDSIPQPPA